MRYLFIFLFLSVHGICKPQSEKFRDQYLSLNLIQIRESFNFGFIFTGPQIQYGRDWQWQKNNKKYEFETQIGFSPVSNKGTGFDFHLAPFNFRYLFKVTDQLWIGPIIFADYNYEFYPELQTGYDFWFSHYSVGTSFFYKKKFQTHTLSIRLYNSLMGLTSRTPENFDVFFFDLGLKYAIRDLHNQMAWNYIGQYTDFHLEVRLNPNQAGRLSLSYLIDYTRYNKTPDWTRLGYGIKIALLPKK